MDFIKKIYPNHKLLTKLWFDDESYSENCFSLLFLWPNDKKIERFSPLKEIIEEFLSVKFLSDKFTIVDRLDEQIFNDIVLIWVDYTNEVFRKQDPSSFSIARLYKGCSYCERYLTFEAKKHFNLLDTPKITKQITPHKFIYDILMKIY